MKQITAQTQVAVDSAIKAGTATGAYQRVTIQRLSARLIPYDLTQIKGTFLQGDKQGKGRFSSLYFGQDDAPFELPNVASVQWQRSIDSDTATCTITLWNTEVLPMGQVPTGVDASTIDMPGYMTPNRGSNQVEQDRWGHTENGWKDLLLPDRVIKTYEGYGYDESLIPELDPHMYPSGVWLIDDVTFTTDGLITLVCRDLGRALLDQLVLPPVVPAGEYPLNWATYTTVQNPDVITPTLVKSWFRPTYDVDSNKYFVGKGLLDGKRAYVDANGAVAGHLGAHAFDSTSLYWLSTGYQPTWKSAYPFVQGKFSARDVAAVRVTTVGGPYVAYVSVFSGGKWQGTTTVPYKSPVGTKVKGEPPINTGAAIPFVAKKTVIRNGVTEIILPKAYANATKVRITFSALKNSAVGTLKYRAGVRDVMVLRQSTVPVVTDGGTHVEGNYGDYTDVVKWALAWGGFFWPSTNTDAYVTMSDGTKLVVTPATSDTAVLPFGRVWGDFEQTGTAGVTQLNATSWDKQPLMDMISGIRDIIGFNFFIDELGGAIWRSPNFWQVGNYLWDPLGGPAAGRTTAMVTIDEKTTLTQLSVKLSSRTVRDKVFVANVAGNFGAVSYGFNPAPSGITRIGGYTDQHFESEQECQLMADMITLRQYFQYRTDSVTIVGNPAIQIDDQVQIFERVTGESYVHYVRGISSSWDRLTGRWTYDLDTNWLGTAPGVRWAVDTSKMSADTIEYLKEQGKI